VQSLHFIQLGLRKEPGEPIAMGRVDQYLYPYYKKDLEEELKEVEKEIEETKKSL
jgi:pyruvate-formate lyase